MPCSWTLHTLDVPFAAFMEFPNFWTWMTFTNLLVLVVSVDKLGRKLDRIMKHLGLEEEPPKPAPAPTALQSWAKPRNEAFQMHARAWGAETRRVALQVWAHPRLRPLSRLVEAGIVRTGRFIDRLLYRTPPGKSPAQDEV
ncbi:hypothetical protein [Paludisphaera borealis]|uniref:Uncharacterized protein n=1 Tax=Paludisphaera borealis TaxID=1387353 RepID=A0A1U7CNV7_9BACT|nr:hypothetical protein [Paludisphaera borealis]APW60622.1 hypothetical protein BSF38_02099 [Paludisphaera borealis]